MDSSGYSTEVVLGGWDDSRSVIRELGSDSFYTWAQTRDILHCAEYRQFWVSWRGDVLKVGRGPVYGQQVRGIMVIITG